MNKPSIEDMEALLQIVAASEYAEFHFHSGDLEIFLSDRPPAASSAVVDTAGVVAEAVPAPPRAEPTSDAELQGLVVLTAPSLGHFYRSPKPGAPPFVELGQLVDVHDTVCVIEVMKLFTLLEAGHKGILRKIYVDDGALVEFGQPLMVLEPSA